MRVILKAGLGLALVVCAAPAFAAERDCVASYDAALGESLVDQFFYEEGMGEAPPEYLGQLQAAVEACLDQFAVTKEDSLVFTELNVGYAMANELRRRLTSVGVDVDMLDRGMVPHIPTAGTTFDQMFDNLGPEFQAESDRLAASGLDAYYADSLVGAYTGAFHSTYVAQLRWDAR
jgi:hypothetical protein